MIFAQLLVQFHLFCRIRLTLLYPIHIALHMLGCSGDMFYFRLTIMRYFLSNGVACKTSIRVARVLCPFNFADVAQVVQYVLMRGAQ